MNNPIMPYNYHTWSKYMVREAKDKPTKPHYAAVLLGTRKEYTPAYSARDSGSCVDTPEVSYFYFGNKSDLELWVRQATAAQLKFFFFYVPALGTVETQINIEVKTT